MGDQQKTPDFAGLFAPFGTTRRTREPTDHQLDFSLTGAR
jgi:hypothetical protein